MPVTAPTKSRSVPGSKTVNTAPLHTGTHRTTWQQSYYVVVLVPTVILMHHPKVMKQYGKGQKNRLFLANDICGYYSTDMKDTV